MAWQNKSEKGNAWVLNLTLMLYRCIGKQGLKKWLVPIVIFWYWLFNPQTKCVSSQYLNRIQPRLQDAQHLPLSTYQHLKHYGLGFVDKLAGWAGDIDEHSLVLHGHEHFKNHYGQGAIVLTSHFGNIELLRALKTNHHQIVNVLVYQKHAAAFNRLIERINPNALVRLISVDELGVDTAIFLQERLNAGEWLMVAADRTPMQSERTDILPFLGHDSAWPQGAWLLAQLLKCPVLAVFCYPHQNQNHVHIHFLSENEPVARAQRAAHMRQLMQDYIALIEQHCAVAPYQWFNFYPFWHLPHHPTSPSKGSAT